LYTLQKNSSKFETAAHWFASSFNSAYLSSDLEEGLEKKKKQSQADEAEKREGLRGATKRAKYTPAPRLPGPILRCRHGFQDGSYRVY